MELILLANQSEPAGALLLQTVLKVAPPDRVELLGGVGELGPAIRRPRRGETVALLLAESREVLDQLVGLADLLHKFRLLLLLPDGEPETLAQGHLLRPRYLGYADQPMSQVGQVLQRLAGWDETAKREKEAWC